MIYITWYLTLNDTFAWVKGSRYCRRLDNLSHAVKFFKQANLGISCFYKVLTFILKWVLLLVGMGLRVEILRKWLDKKKNLIKVLGFKLFIHNKQIILDPLTGLGKPINKRWKLILTWKSTPEYQICYWNTNREH